ncbi:MAG: hypothetical protein ACRD5M_12035 [Candidatus Acidiferrales bacterium]
MIEALSHLLSIKTELLWAALVSTAVSAAVSYYFRRREARHKLAVEYEYEQRKKLRDLIGCYHGRLLQVCNSLNYRLWNLYTNANAAWLDSGGDYQKPGYYMLSFVHRFLAVFSFIRQFENEAIYVDGRIAEKKDFIFLNYLDAIRWVMTDVALFEGITYDGSHQRDHFFADNFRQYCDGCSVEGNFITYEKLKDHVATLRSLDPVFAYFDSLRPSEDRLRWDRLIALHLLLMAFINSFGYRPQYSSQTNFDSVAGQVRRQRILDNLVDWLPRHGLGKDKESKRIIHACQALRKSRAKSDGLAKLGPRPGAD